MSSLPVVTSGHSIWLPAQRSVATWMKKGPLRARVCSTPRTATSYTASGSRPSTSSTGMPNVRGIVVRSLTDETEVGKPPPIEPSAPELLFSQM